MTNRRQIWVKLTSALCMFSMLSMQAQPVLAAVAQSARHATSASMPVAPATPLKASPTKVSPQATGSGKSGSAAQVDLSASSPLSKAAAARTARKQACVARQRLNSALTGSGMGTPAVANAGRIMGMPNAATAADGGDAAFNRGLARLFASPGARSDAPSLEPHNEHSDDECDDIDSPVPPLLRMAHPVLEDVGAPYSALAYADRETTLQFEDVKVVIPAGALVQDTHITIRPIPEKQAGTLDEGMTSVVPGQRAFRLGPHGIFFQKPITLVLPYQHGLLPPGMTEEDVGTFYFDSEAGRWRRVHVREVREGEGAVIAETEHFTDFINATIASPDHPTAASFDQNTVANLKGMEPTAGLEMISPPSGSSDGSAHLAYRFNVPPGRHAMQPDLTLQYNSSGGNGWAGLGWDVSISKIHVDTRFGVPHYDSANETELYALDGDDLSPKGSTGTPKQRALAPTPRQAEQSYVRRMEGSFSTIIRHGSSPFATSTNAYSWEVIDKNGTKYFYGTDHFSRLSNPATGAIAEWMLAKVVDSSDNRMNYEYQFRTGSLGTQQWVQAYPWIIRYTDDSRIFGEQYVQFELEDGLTPPVVRLDSFSSARYGFLVRTAERLHAVYVSYTPVGIRPVFNDNLPQQCSALQRCQDLLRRYLFNYNTGEYQKSLLQFVDVQGIAGDGAEVPSYHWETEHRTSLSYYQRAVGNVPSFSSSTSWGNIGSSQVFADSSSKASGGNAFFGVGLCKVFHGGIGGGLSGGSENTSQAFMDFNGDGLPDFLGKNTAYLGHRAPTDPLSFKSVPSLNDNFYSTSQWTESVNLAVHAFAERASVGIDWAWDQSNQHGGFADVDGDGFIDWITPDGNIQHNQGDTTTKTLGGFSPPTTQLDAATLQAIDDASPRADPVVRWVAPYHGTVAFGGPLQRKAANGGDVLTEIWRSGGGSPIWSRVFGSSDLGVCTPGPSDSCGGGFTFTVNAGDRFYFRTRAQGDITNTAMLWDPQFSYQTVCNGAACGPVSVADHARVEPWGAHEFDFSQAADFRLAGPPDRAWPTQLPATNVPVLVKGIFNKVAPTPDDVVIEISHTDDNGQVIAGTSYTQTIPAAQTGPIDIGATLATTPFLMSGTLDGARLVAEVLHFRVKSDTPVDPAAFVWDPTVTFQQYCRTPPTENSTQVCGAVSCPDGPDDTPCSMVGDPMPDTPLLRGQIVQHAPVTYSTYLVQGAPNGGFLTDNLPTQPFAAPEAGPFTATLSYALAASAEPAGGDDAVLVVQGKQGLLGKFKVAASSFSSGVQVNGTTAAVNEPIYFMAYRKGSQELDLAADVRFTNTNHVYSVPSSALNLHRVHAWNDSNEADNFSGGYQQWSTAQWTETRPTSDPNSQIPAFSGDAIEQPHQVPNDSSSATTSPIAPTVSLRTGLPPNLLQQLPGFAGPVWVSSGADFYVAAGEVKPSRNGANPQTVALAASSGSFRKGHGSTREGGVSFVAQLGLSESNSTGDADTLDMNGDRYPDWFDGQSVRLGDGNGGFGAPQSVGAGDEVRKFHGTHSRFGISGGPSGGVKQSLSGSGKADVTVPVSASAGRIYGRTKTTADLVDVNGDGLPDRVDRSSGDAPFTVRLNLGYSFGPPFTFAGASEFSKDIPVDVGNFAPEAHDSGALRLQTDITNSIQGGVPVGVGDGIGFSGGGGLAYVTTRTLIDFADVNGDGLPDRVFKIPDDPALRVELNLGEQFAPEQVWNLPGWDNGQIPSGGPLGVFGSRDALSYSEGSQFHLDVGFGYEFVIFLAVCGAVEAAVQYRNTHTTSQLEFTDIDGDGFSDQLLKRDDTGAVFAKINQDGAQHFNLLKTVENPIGGKISLDYSREGNTVALPENQWVLSSVNVDDGLTGAFHDTPRTTTFLYEGGLYNRDERENFGFSKVTATRPDQSKVVQSYRQDRVCTKGLLGSSVEQDSAGRLFRSSQTVYDLRAGGSVDSCFPAATQEVTSFFEGLTTDITKPGKTLSEQRDYDAFGNITFYSNAGDTGTADDLSYTVQYDPTLAAIHIFRANLVKALDAQNNVLRRRDATYFGSSGLIRTMHDTVNGGHDPATGAPYVNQVTPDWVFSYVADGNLETTTDPTGFHLLYDYDPGTFTYITGTRDSFGYSSSAVPDPGLGVFTSITDINGSTESFFYNSVTPRLFSMQAPGEAAAPGSPQTVSVTYSDLKPGERTLPASAIVNHYDATAPSDPLQTATFVDGLGRTIQTKKETEVDNGSGGTRHGFAVSGPTIFDERGRVQAQGQPAFTTDAVDAISTVALSRPTQFQYDVLSRPTAVLEPNGGTISTAYSIGTFDGAARFTTTVTDPNNNKRISYQDVRGQLVGIDQFNTIAGAIVTLTTRYSYDPLGQLLQVSDAKGNKTTSVFDTVGHLVDLTSPDSGHTSYRYDLAGRLIAKQTPNLVTGNKVITFAYDFNRLKSLDLPSTAGLIDYVYTYGDADGIADEKGRLIHITDPSGDEARFYDELGRMTSSQFTPAPQSTTAPKPSYTTQFKYDSLGRLLNLTYPDGEVVSYGYDGGGAMNSVSGKFPSATTTPYVQKITYDEFGQRKSITLGNGAVTKYSYDPNMRWLSDINTASGSTTIQNNHYTFDNVGNILTAANNIAIPAPVAPNGPIAPGPTSQTFGYDKLYQLTSASGRYDGCACGCNNHRDYTFAQTYDEIGNIKTKVVTDKITWPTGGRVDTQAKTTYNNAYTYGSTRPHAPTKIGAQTLGYDNDGNQTASTGTFEVGREVTWNELEQLTKEVDSSYTNTYLYNSSGERTHKRRTSLETVYVNPYYVIRNLLFQTKHIYAGPTRIVSAVVTLNDYKKLTTNQTPILFYYHSDQLGSTGYITDRTGQILEHEEYLPGGESWFEELKNSSANNRLPWQFNSKELDETGLYYYGARYYNPRAGVWMSPDPAFDGAFGSPMGMALYTYAHNNPVRFTDPMGLSAKTGTWTPEDSLNLGGMKNGETAALGMHLSGPGTANAHATPSASKFDNLTPIPPPAPNWRDDGNPGHQALAQLTGDAPEMRGPQLRRAAYSDTAKTSAVIAANIAVLFVPGVGEERGLASAASGIEALAVGGPETFEILDGVRRAKAAQLSGLDTIAAEIDVGGRTVATTEVPLSALRSPKPVIDTVTQPSALKRWLDTLRLTAGGSKPPPIRITPGSRGTPIDLVGVGRP